MDLLWIENLYAQRSINTASLSAAPIVQQDAHAVVCCITRPDHIPFVPGSMHLLPYISSSQMWIYRNRNWHRFYLPRSLTNNSFLLVMYTINNAMVSFFPAEDTLPCLFPASRQNLAILHRLYSSSGR